MRELVTWALSGELPEQREGGVRDGKGSLASHVPAPRHHVSKGCHAELVPCCVELNPTDRSLQSSVCKAASWVEGLGQALCTWQDDCPRFRVAGSRNLGPKRGDKGRVSRFWISGKRPPAWARVGPGFGSTKGRRWSKQRKLTHRIQHSPTQARPLRQSFPRRFLDQRRSRLAQGPSTRQARGSPFL